MERAVAIRKLGQILGKKLGYRVDPKAPTREEREAAKIELRAALTERVKLREQRDERRRAILAADPEYQKLNAEHQAACKRVDKLGSITRHYKITVGETNDIFFLHRAEGDSWEEVIEKLTIKKSAAA